MRAPGRLLPTLYSPSGLQCNSLEASGHYERDGTGTAPGIGYGAGVPSRRTASPNAPRTPSFLLAELPKPAIKSLSPGSVREEYPGGFAGSRETAPARKRATSLNSKINDYTIDIRTPGSRPDDFSSSNTGDLSSSGIPSTLVHAYRYRCTVYIVSRD